MGPRRWEQGTRDEGQADVQGGGVGGLRGGAVTYLVESGDLGEVSPRDREGQTGVDTVKMGGHGVSHEGKQGQDPPSPSPGSHGQPSPPRSGKKSETGRGQWGAWMAFHKIITCIDFSYRKSNPFMKHPSENSSA